MAAAGKSEQRKKLEEADKRPLNPTRHDPDNASNSLKDCSMIVAGCAKECVNHDSKHARELDPERPFGPDRRLGSAKHGRQTKFIFPVLALIECA
jgi:hypothetical protein